MGTSEPLVPQGMEHGKRAELEAAMEAGGVPKAPTGGGPPSFPPPSAPGRPSPSPTSSVDMAGWDVLANREPSGVIQPPGQPTDAKSLFQHRLDTTTNSAAKYYFGRYADFLE